MFFIAIVFFVVITVLLYNSLIAKKNEVENIFGSIDTILKKRYDLIPSLVEIAKQYMQYEQELLTKVTQLRSKALKSNTTQTDKMALENEISSTLGSIMVAVENYPELKANEHLLHLQHSLMEVEEQLSAARRAYNQAVTNYNNAIEMVPTNLMASMMHYQPKELFSVEEKVRENIEIKKLFEQ